MPDAPMRVVLFHNAGCSKSRAVLTLIRAAGIEPELVEYLSNPPGRSALAAMIAAAGLQVRDALRTGEPGCESLQLGTASDDALLDAMCAHPRLIQRPFVVTPLGTRLCRPPERVSEILPR